MLRFMCKSKIHRATINRCDLHYSGSIGIDKDLLEASDILPNEMVQVLNVNNGERFETYAIEEERGSGTIALYGPATHKGRAGDKVIIISYCVLEERQAGSVKPRIVLVNDDNKNMKLKK